MQTEILVPILMLVTWLVGRLPKVKPAYLPYIAVTLGIVVELVTGTKAANAQQVLQGAFEGLAASGLWSAAGKHAMQRMPAPSAKRG